MKDYIPSRASMFLVELIVAILFFTAASAVCVQLFAQAHSLTVQTKNLSEAVNKSQNMAEALDGCHGSLDKVNELFPLSVKTDTSLLLYFDSSWQECSQSRGSYYLEVTLDQTEFPLIGNISVRETAHPKTPIFSLKAAVTPSQTVTD